MFDFFKKKSQESTGMKKYTQLKKLMKNSKTSEAVMLGASDLLFSAPHARIDDKYHTAVELVNYLSLLTGIPETELVYKIVENKHDKIITSAILDNEGGSKAENKSKEISEAYGGECVGSDDSWMDVLLHWASENNLIELQDFNSFAYKQTGFPKNKNQFNSIEYLHLPNSNISFLPPELGKLKNLRAICLDENNIDTYPKEMCDYKFLHRLDLDDNKISILPKEIGNLISLKKLSLMNNRITDLPIELTKLVNLRSVDLSGQAIKLSGKESPLSDEGWDVMDFFIRRDVIKY